MESIAGNPVSTPEDIEASRQRYAKEQAELPLKALMAEFGGESPQARAIAEGLQKQGITSIKDIEYKKVPATERVSMFAARGPNGDLPLGIYDEYGGPVGGITKVGERVVEPSYGEGGFDPGGVVWDVERPTGEYISSFINKKTNQPINPNRVGIIQNGQAGVTGGDVFFNLNADENGNVKFDPQWSPRSKGFLGSDIGQLILTAGSIIPNPLTPAFVGVKAGYALAHGQPLQALAAVLPYGLQELATAGNLSSLAGSADFVSTAATSAGKIAEAVGVPSAYADAAGRAGVAALRSGLTGGDMGKAILMSQLPSPGSFVKNAGDFSRGIAGFDVGDTSEFDANALKGLDGWNSWEGGDNAIDVYGALELPPGAKPDEAKPPEPYILNPDAVLDPVTIRANLSDYGDPDYVTPFRQGMVDDTWTTENIPYELPNDPNYVTPFRQGMVDDTWTNEGIPSVAPSEPTKPSAPTKPSGPTNPKLDLNGLLSLFALGSTFNQPKLDAKFENFQSPTDLKGGYAFDWNAQDFNKPEGGVAYSQPYYGQHWNKTMAQGGITSIPFAHTVGDSGVHANKPSSIATQVIQHLRSGGHVMDDKAHSEVKYLASKGEPVHHIVGFMKHRMGGITSLGSYSDGGQLLKGPGDGMSDDIPATIADKQPARLANEEFVIPADVVSHLGNGSSESGAKVLYDMMAKVRKARTGNPKQGKQIDAHKFMPKAKTRNPKKGKQINAHKFMPKV
jgi:hypothetical protein